MNIHLIDANCEVVDALRRAFTPFEQVTISAGDILKTARVCVVSPANSYGFMDGGIDAAYRQYFGASIEDIVREAIGKRPEGHSPVGASLVVRTGDAKTPYLLVAPTMLMPEAVPAIHCRRAMHAVLRAAQAAGLSDVFCPGLGTGVGAVAPDDAASAMAAAYQEWKARAHAN